MMEHDLLPGIIEPANANPTSFFGLLFNDLLLNDFRHFTVIYAPPTLHSK
jgi:hypothetical protein